MASISELTGGRADASRAGGLPSGPTPQGIGSDILDVFNRTNQQLQAQRFNWDAMRYQQGIKDRDTVLDLIADSNAKVDFDILDKDQKALNEKEADIRNTIVDTIRKNGRLNGDLDKYKEIQQKRSELGKLAQVAKARSITSKQLLQDASKEVNAIDRNRMMEHYNNEILNTDVSHLPTSYFKRYTYDLNTMFPKVEPKESAINYSQGEDGNWYETKVSQTPLASFRYPILAVTTGDSNAIKNLQDYQMMYQDFLSSPLSKDPAYIKQFNAFADKINTENNIKEGNLDYVPHLGEVDADGNVTQLVDSPAQYARLNYLMKDYKRNDIRELSKEGRAQAEARSEIQRRRDQTSIDKSQVAQGWERLKLANKEFELKKQEADNKKNATEGTAYGAAAAVTSIAERYGNKTPLTKGIGSNVRESLGLSPNAQFIEIPKTDKTAVNIMTDPTYGDESSGTPGRLSGRQIPARLFMVKDGSSVKFVSLPDPKTFTGAQIVDIAEAAPRLIQYNNNWNISDKDNVAMGLASNVIREQFGNGAVPATTENVQEPTTSSQLSVPPTSELRQQGNEIQVKVNGQWRKAIGRDADNNIIVE